MIRTRGWTNEQIDMLKDAYSRNDISVGELSLLINKSETAICVMAKNLNLKKRRIRTSMDWSEEEEEFLKRVYPEYDTTALEIAKTLGKKEYSVKQKARELGLKRLTENEHLAKMGKKRCPTCNEILPFGDFQNNKSKYDGLSSQCKACCAFTRKKKILDSKNNEEDSNSISTTTKQCIICKEIKLQSDFYGFSNRCKECRKKQMRERKLKDLIEKGYC